MNYFDETYSVNKLLEVKTAAEIDALIIKKKKFCCFVVSNSKASKRIDFFHKLSKYKCVDSGGGILNNVGGRVENKLDFIGDY